MNKPDVPCNASRLGWNALLAFCLLAWFTALPGTAVAGEDDLLRVTCRGMFKLSVTETTGECAEDDMLTDPAGGLMSAFSAAIADLGAAELRAGAAGGAIRGVGYIGREASALILQTYYVEGDWRGDLPVVIRARVRYGFGGNGQASALVALRSSTIGDPRGSNRANIRVRHSEFGGAVIEAIDPAGNYALPGEGSYPSRSSIDLSVYEHLPESGTGIEVRVDLFVYATPGLTSFDTSVSAVANVEVVLELEAPCPVTARSRDGELEVKLSTEPASSDDWQCTEAPEVQAGRLGGRDTLAGNLPGEPQP